MSNTARIPATETPGAMPVTRETRPRRSQTVFFWVTLGLGSFVLALYVCAAWLLVLHGGKEQVWGWTSGYARGFVEVTTVDPTSSAGKLLRPGDRVVSIAGESRLSLTTLRFVLRRAAAMERYPMVVGRDGTVLELELPPPEVVRRWRWTGLGSRLVVGLSCFALAVLLGLADPWSPSARRLGLALFAAAPFFLWNAVQHLAPFLVGWESWAVNAMLLLHPLHFAFGFHFFATFPEGRTGARWVRWTTFGLYAGGFAIVLLRPLRWTIEHSGVASGDAAAQASLWHLHDYLFLAWILAAMLAVPVVLLHNFRRVTDVGLRRRLRWVVFGVAAGTLPFF